MKKFLTISLALFVLAVMAAVGVYWYLSMYTATVPSLSTLQDALRSDGNGATSTSRVAADMATDTVAAVTSTFVIPEEGIALSSLPLTDAQKNTLTSVGVDASTFILTPPMLECGAEKIGNDRIEAMSHGAAPTFLEITKLVPCLGAG